MTGLDPLFALAGIGLVLFGLRALLLALDDGIAARIRPWAERLVARSWRAFAAGVGATFALQASAVTVIAAMGLLQRRLLGLDQAILVMLGATLGTSLKVWLFALPFDWLGPIAVGLASLGLVVSRGYARRRALEIVFALGALYLGWDMLCRALGPLLQREGVAGVLLGLDVSSTLGLWLAVGVGCTITALVQSSSTVVFVVVGLGASGAMRPDTGVALILGANLGTTITPLLVSLEYRAVVRRLAVAHVLVKLVGVLVAMLFFGWSLSALQAASGVLGGGPAVELAAAHTGFNLINSLAWAPLAPFLARKLSPRDGEGDARGAPLLSDAVRRLLTNLPAEAVEQVELERVRSLREIKVLLDQLFMAMRSVGQRFPTPPGELLARVRAGQELLAGVLVRNEWTPRMQTLLHELSCLEEIAEETIGLLQRVEIESGRFRELRSRAAPAFEVLEGLFDRAWTPILTGCATEIEAGAFALFEAETHRLVCDEGPVAEQEAVLLGKQIAHLQRIWTRLRELDRLPAGAPPPVTAAATPVPAPPDVADPRRTA